MNKFEDIHINLINKVNKKILKDIIHDIENSVERKTYKEEEFDIEINLKNIDLNPTDIKIFEDNTKPIFVFKEKIDSIHELKLSFLSLDKIKQREVNVQLIKIEIAETRYESIVQVLINLKDKSLDSLGFDSKNVGKYSLNNKENLYLYEKLEKYLTYKELEDYENSFILEDYFQLNYDINIKTDPLYMAMNKIFEKIYKLLNEK